MFDDFLVFLCFKKYIYSMKFPFFTSLFLFFIILNTHSQTGNLYTLYQNNTNIINPAYAGSHETLDIGIAKSWLDVDPFKLDSYKDKPTFFAVNIHSPISKGIGLGFSYENAEIGPLKEKDYNLDFSYKYNLKDDSSLAVGVKVGRHNLDFPINNLDLNGNNTTIDRNTFTLSNIGSGVYYKNKKLHAGLAYSYYFGEYLRLQDSGFIIDETYSNSITNAFVAYLLTFSEKIKLKPSLMILKSSEMDKPWFFISGELLVSNDLSIGVHYNFSKWVAFSLRTPLLLKTFDIGLQADIRRKKLDFLEASHTQYYNYISISTNFYIDAFKKGNIKRYF